MTAPGWSPRPASNPTRSASRWSLIGIVAAGLIMLMVARFFLRSPFFSNRRESDAQGG